MKNISLLPADTYTVINKTILNDQDRKLLTMLYQPIIGGLAINLYFTLWSNLDSSEIVSQTYNHHSLMSILRINLEDIIESRKKLEAMGLVKTYLKKGSVNSYIYELYSPLSAYDFINNPILNTTLCNNIGSKEYERTINFFKVPKVDLSEYSNISCLFSDVFESRTMNEIMYNNIEIKKCSTIELSMTPTIDFNNVISLIPDGILNTKTINNEMKEFIYKISFIYNLNDEAMSEIIRNSINEKGCIDKDLLKTNTRNFYRFENLGKLPSIIYKNQPDYLKNVALTTSPREKMIYTFENTSPYEFICSKNKGIEPSKNDLLVIEKMLIDFDLKPGVVNVLIDYVLKINNNKLILPFVEVIASQWKKSGIETVKDAMLIAEKEYKGKKTKTKREPIKNIEAKPEWFDKEINKISPTQVEKNEIEELLKEFK